MKTSMTIAHGKALMRAMLVLSGLGVALSGCVYSPGPYGYEDGRGERYAPNYAYAPAPNYYGPRYGYSPGYYAGPTIVFGGGGREGHERRR
jgi:hypothetical protein